MLNSMVLQGRGSRVLLGPIITVGILIAIQHKRFDGILTLLNLTDSMISRNRRGTIGRNARVKLLPQEITTCRLITSVDRCLDREPRSR